MKGTVLPASSSSNVLSTCAGRIFNSLPRVWASCSAASDSGKAISASTAAEAVAAGASDFGTGAAPPGCGMLGVAWHAGGLPRLRAPPLYLIFGARLRGRARPSRGPQPSPADQQPPAVPPACAASPLPPAAGV